MKAKKSPFKVMGQRSLPSSFFLSRDSNRSAADFKEDATSKAPPNKDSRVSLSDFLDRKLHKASLLPKTVQGKQMSFSSLVNSGDFSGSMLGKIGVKNERETEVKCVIEEAVFKQFAYDKKEKEDCLDSCYVGEIGSSDTNCVREPRKKKNPFEGGDEKASTLKHVVVLGADPKPKQKRREERFISNKKPKPIYNHYANGSGWWDCNMEGLDSGVGCSEAWEGMGSTTLGGLEWH